MAGMVNRFTNLVGFYAEMEVPGYRDLCERMYASAENFPVYRVHIADSTTPFLKNAFTHLRLDTKATLENLVACKAIGFARWGLQATENTVYTDMDVLWKRDPTPLFDQDFDIAVIHRMKPPYPMMPYNGGLMLAKPTAGARGFWRLYHRLIATSPECTKGWWCEQLALACLLGLHRKPGDIVQIDDAKILVMDAHEVCRVAKPGQSEEGAYALHFKGYAGAKDRMAAA